MKKHEFYIGQRIKQRNDDGDGSYWAYGHVKEIHDDYILIQWNDIYEPVKHYDDEWDSIKKGLPTVD